MTITSLCNRHYQLVTGLSLILFSSLASAESGAVLRDKTMLEPQSSHEICLRLEPEDQLRYSFNASADLEFNLHYHTNEQVFSPIPNHPTASESGTFTASHAENYCLMWTNSGESAVELIVEYKTAAKR